MVDTGLLMQIKRFVSLFVTAAFVAAVLMSAGCSGGSEDYTKDAPPAKKPGSIPPPSDLPSGAMKKTGKG
jgi:hypothetical protein